MPDNFSSESSDKRLNCLMCLSLRATYSGTGILSIMPVIRRLVEIRVALLSFPDLIGESSYFKSLDYPVKPDNDDILYPKSGVVAST